jgi:hypothetical protein
VLHRHSSRWPAAGLAALTALGLGACGSSDKKKGSSASGADATVLALTIKESGKNATFTGPKTTKGGLVHLKVTNTGKAPHGAQLVRYTGGHSIAEVKKVIASNGDKIPEWIHAEGGVLAGPGDSRDGFVNLDPGDYVIVDSASEGPPGSVSQLTVSGGKSGDLPKTPTTVTADETGKDKFKWDVQGPLKIGPNQVTFNSKGKESLHFIGVFRLKKDTPLPTIQKALAKQNGPPPPFVDQASFFVTPILDGGKSQTTPVLLRGKPGTYVLFCPLKDRDGGKSHDQEGLLTKVTVK